MQQSPTVQTQSDDLVIEFIKLSPERRKRALLLLREEDAVVPDSASIPSLIDILPDDIVNTIYKLLSGDPTALSGFFRTNWKLRRTLPPPISALHKDCSAHWLRLLLVKLNQRSCMKKAKIEVDQPDKLTSHTCRYFTLRYSEASGKWHDGVKICKITGLVYNMSNNPTAYIHEYKLLIQLFSNKSAKVSAILTNNHPMVTNNMKESMKLSDSKASMAWANYSKGKDVSEYPGGKAYILRRLMEDWAL